MLSPSVSPYPHASGRSGPLAPLLRSLLTPVCTNTNTVYHSPTLFPAFNSQRMIHIVSKSNRTHGKKTPISSFSRLWYHDMCTVFFDYSDIHCLTSRLSLSVYTIVPNTSLSLTPYPTLPQPLVGTPPTHFPRPARLRVTKLPRA